VTNNIKPDHTTNPDNSRLIKVAVAKFNAALIVVYRYFWREAGENDRRSTGIPPNLACGPMICVKQWWKV
jgi:hypothetical protein